MDHHPSHDEFPLEDETAPALAQDNQAEAEPVPSADEPAFPASPPAPSRIASMLRGAARGLAAVVFSQYVMVTALVAAVAIVLSKTVSDVLVDQFDTIARALWSF